MNYRSALIKLAGATLIAQIISIAFIPVISRLYSPDDFAVFTFWASIGGLVGGVLSLKQEQFLLSRPKNEWPPILARIFFTYKISVLIFLIAFAVYVPFSDGLYSGKLILAFFYCLSTSLIISFSNIANICAHFSSLAKARIYMSFVLGSSQAGLGLLSDSQNALLIGAVGSQLTFLAFLYPKIRHILFQPEKSPPSRPSINDVKKSMSSIVSSMTLSVATSFPPVMLYSLGYQYEAGIVAMLQRFMLIPVTLLASPLSQTFISLLKNLGDNPLSKKFLVNAVLFSFSYYFLSYVVALAAGKLTLFSFILGAQWTEADVIAPSIVTIYTVLLIRNISTQYFVVTERQGSLMKIDIIFIISMLAGYALAKTQNLGFSQYLLSLNLSYFIYMVTPVAYIAQSNRRPRKHSHE
ncbi:hypothetical protein PS850_02604 [Pseudomonas fluorescens]|nr:hypothetical protein PS850_02604 [Pseudomonas fluorescens]